MGIQFRTPMSKKLEGDLVFECQSKRRSTKDAVPHLEFRSSSIHSLTFLNALKSKRKGDGHLFYFLPMAATFDRIVCFTPKKNSGEKVIKVL